MNRRFLPVCVAAHLLLVAVRSAIASDIVPPNAFVGRSFPSSVDSGRVFNNQPGARSVFETEVGVPGATWLRVRFVDSLLAGDPKDGDGSYLLITSMLDGAAQYLNATHLAQWQNTSAYFNGDTVRIELFAYAGTGPNQVRVAELVA